MRLLLIHPERRLKSIGTRKLRKVRRRTGYPAMGLFTVAALTPRDIDVKVVDESVEEIDESYDPDLVGISVLTYSAPYAYDMSEEYRRQGIPVVLGGIHPSLNPEEALEHSDAVVVGEAELTWPELIEDFRSGRLKKLYRSAELPDLDKG